MNRIIYTRPDGGLSVVIPAGDLQLAIDALPKDAIAPQVVGESVIPSDRTFRNAWTHGGDKVDVDMEKCREIQKDRLRAMRTPLFEENDLALRDAMLSGDEKAKVIALARRDELRDATELPAIQAAITADELKEAIPDCLKTE